MKLREILNYREEFKQISLALVPFLGYYRWDDYKFFDNLRAEYEENNKYDNKAVKIYSKDIFIGYIRKDLHENPLYTDDELEALVRFINRDVYRANYYYYDFYPNGEAYERVIGQKIYLSYRLKYRVTGEKLKLRAILRECFKEKK